MTTRLPRDGTICAPPGSDQLVTSDQLSPDSASAGLHDAHRGAGSFDWARAGIELLRARGFTVKVAATIDEADAAEEQQLRALLDADGIPREDQLVRRVAGPGDRA